MELAKSTALTLNIQHRAEAGLSLPSQIPYKSNVTFLSFCAIYRCLVLTHEAVIQLMDLYPMFSLDLPNHATHFLPSPAHWHVPRASFARLVHPTSHPANCLQISLRDRDNARLSCVLAPASGSPFQSIGRCAGHYSISSFVMRENVRSEPLSN